MWVRQEYKPEKARFQHVYELELGGNEDSEAKDCKMTRKVKLEQNYSGLGTTVWDGSIALAKMFDNRERFPREKLAGYSVLELGAGCGLVGIYLSLLGAKRTVLTDQECCIPTLTRNIELNVDLSRSTSREIAAMEYSWGNDTSNLIKGGLFDLIVAAEVLYSEQDSITLANCILKVTHPSSIIFISMGRNRLGENAFVRTLTEHGFVVQEVGIILNTVYPWVPCVIFLFVIHFANTDQTVTTMLLGLDCTLSICKNGRGYS